MSTIHASRQALDLRATVAGNVQLARHLADVSQAELRAPNRHRRERDLPL